MPGAHITLAMFGWQKHWHSACEFYYAHAITVTEILWNGPIAFGPPLPCPEISTLEAPFQGEREVQQPLADEDVPFRGGT